MTAFDAEKWADYCMPLSDDLTICGTRTVEDESARRVEYRWCFDCRTRHDFTWRLMVPDAAYYGPHWSIEGEHEDCTDMFPGCSRTWYVD